MGVFKKASRKVERIIREEITQPERRAQVRRNADAWGCSNCPNKAYCAVEGCQR